MDYVSDYLENEGYPILEEAWKLALQRLKSGSDCVTLGFSADRRHRFDVEERAFRLGSAYQSVLCAQLLGNLLCRLQRLEEGVTAFREAIRLGPVHASTYYFLGLALVTLKRYQEAVAPLSKATAGAVGRSGHCASRDDTFGAGKCGCTLSFGPSADNA